VQERPLVWEHRLFAGLLTVGLEERSFKWQDFELGISDDPRELSVDEFLTYWTPFFTHRRGGGTDDASF
jgi:hypothetical protein